jgi:hypothetical protein
VLQFEHVRVNLTNYQVPQEITMLDKLPRSNTGRSCTVTCRRVSVPVPIVRRRWAVLRAAAEVLNAANGVRPLGREGYITLPVFAFGWPTTEMAPLYLAGSMLDAVRRGLRGDFRGRRGRTALLLTAIAWALL